MTLSCATVRWAEQCKFSTSAAGNEKSDLSHEDASKGMRQVPKQRKKMGKKTQVITVFHVATSHEDLNKVDMGVLHSKLVSQPSVWRLDI